VFNGLRLGGEVAGTGRVDAGRRSNVHVQDEFRKGAACGRDMGRGKPFGEDRIAIVQEETESVIGSERLSQLCSVQSAVGCFVTLKCSSLRVSVRESA